MISKSDFCDAIESLRLQNAHDIKSGELVKEAFGVEISLLYDNSALVKTIISLLANSFDKSELEHYIFDLNFGKPSMESDWLTPEEFYDNLTK
jgi:hypothetical protein